MGRFLLIMHEHPSDFSEMSPAELQRIIEEYIAWRDGIERQGRLLGSDKLTYEGGRSLTRTGGELRVTDGPYAEAKEVIGGTFMIEAADYDEAVRLASDCPHLVHSQRIEVRAIDEMPFMDDPAA